MKSVRLKGLLLSSVMAAGFVSPAFAQSIRPEDLAARIAALEARFGAVQAELSASKAENERLRSEVNQVRTAVQTAPQTITPPPAPIPVSDGFRSGATTIKLGGFMKVVSNFSSWSDGDVAANSLGRDFYLPQAIPVGGIKESVDNDFAAKQTRLWLNTETTVAGHVLKGYLETDFQTSPGTQGSERTTNGYNLALRRAFITFDKFTFGQDWSTFQNVGVLPETTDFIGTTEGSVFVRQALVRYSTPLSRTTTLQLALENAETATANLGSPTLIENDDDSMPDVVARINHVTPRGDISIAGLFRTLSVDNGSSGDTRTGYGISVAGKYALDAAKRNELRFMASYGTGIGRYLGLNFVPDAVFVGANNSLTNVDNFAAFAALKVGWTPSVRSTFMASYQTADYASELSSASLAAFNKTSWSLGGNLFWSPARGIDLGVEYRRGERELVNGATGSLDRIEFAAKYGF